MQNMEYNNTNYSKVFNNLDIVLNISMYLIEPSVLIVGHKYNKDGSLKVIYNTEYSEKQIINYINVLNNKYSTYMKNSYFTNFIHYNNYIHNTTNYINFDDYLNKNTLLFLIMKDINDINQFWRKINHSIYIDLNYVKYINNNLGMYSHLYQQNTISNYYLNKLYSICQCYDFQYITKHLTDLYQELRIYNFQYEMRYIASYFDEYNELNNHDLTKFTPSNILKFIKEEEHILSILLNDDE